jgi:predicted phosphodiesterase
LIGKDKLTEIVLYCVANGKEATKKAFVINDETMARYMREARKRFGDSLDSIVRLKEQYSDEEIQLLSTGERPLSAHTAVKTFEGKQIKIGVMSDMHYGSIYTDPSHSESVIAEFNRQKVDMVLCPGDIVEGMMGRPGDVYELTHIGYKAQRAEAIRLLDKIEAPFYCISGNHDMSYTSKHGTGANVVEDICEGMKQKGNYLGHDEGDLNINGIVIRLFHGGDGSSYALSYRGQKIIEAISGGEKPAIMLAGHSHKQFAMFYRNIHYIEAGTLQKQSSWMRGKKLAAHVGFFVLDVTIADKEVKAFSPTWYPFYS